MSHRIEFTKENLDKYLYELAAELKRLKCNRRIEIIIVGGASIILNYNFRPSSFDIDAYYVSDVLKQAINNVADKFDLPVDWMNKDFMMTASFSPKIVEFSTFYKEFKNVLRIRTITKEYLIAMKLVSFRAYKNDISDIVNIIEEDSSIHYEDVIKAINNLYSGEIVLDQEKDTFLRNLFAKNSSKQ